MHQTTSQSSAGEVAEQFHLPLALVSQYLFFLSRRPISSSNQHYLDSRLRGLRSLAPVLEASGDAALEHVAERLAALRAATFRNLGPGVQLALLPLANANRKLPTDLVVEDAAPGSDWLDGVRKVLLVLGPGIGIGDELILAPLPRWLEQQRPGIEITTLSGYPGVWDRVAAVDHCRVYRDYLSLLDALRNESDDFDLVILGDFEHPALYPAIATENRLRRYLEISIGSRSAFLLDNERRWLHRLHHVTPYFEGYYAGFDHTLRRLGLAVDDRQRFADPRRDEPGPMGREEPPSPDQIRVFVSPFTSKYEPSEPYWNQMITKLVPASPELPVHIVLDTGKGARSEAFAIALRRSLRARLSADVSVELAPPDTPSGLSLPGVFACLGSCHVVLCADSFCAHAAPLYGCVTVVLARLGLEPWRVPSCRSFYLDADAPVAGSAAAGRRLLADLLGPPASSRNDARFTPAELRLAGLASSLRQCVANPPDDVEANRQLSELFRESSELLRAVVEAARWPEELKPIFEDPFLHQNERAIDPGPPSPALAQYLRDRAERWLATNYCKYLECMAGGASPAAPQRRRAPEKSATSTKPAGAVPSDATVGTVSSVNAGARNQVVQRALGALQRERLPTGEIACHWRSGARDGGAGDGPGHHLEYVQSPVLSTFVHDALGAIDLTSPLLQPQIFDALPAVLRGQLVTSAHRRRREIRRFLAWMESNDGTWRLYGRALGQPADLDTTARAATCLLEAPRRRFDAPGRRHADAILRLLSDETRGDPPDDPGVMANVLRFLAIAGADREVVEALRARLLAQLAGPGLPASERYPDPMAVAWCLTRAWRHARLEGREELAEQLVPTILDTLDAVPQPAEAGPSAGSSNSLSIALAAGALLDLEQRGESLERAFERLRQEALPTGGWLYAPLIRARSYEGWRTGGAAAVSTAIGIGTFLGLGGNPVREAA